MVTVELSDLPRRLVDKIRVDRGGCWFWTGAGTSNGYGISYLDGRTQTAHRVTYQLTVGPIPDGLDLDHLCRTRACVNPAHVEPVDRQTNVARSPVHNGSKTHCPQGHPYDDPLTFRGQRRCRECNRIRCQRRYEKNKVAINARRRRARAHPRGDAQS